MVYVCVRVCVCVCHGMCVPARNIHAYWHAWVDSLEVGVSGLVSSLCAQVFVLVYSLSLSVPRMYIYGLQTHCFNTAESARP